jgi:hypothetical protein
VSASHVEWFLDLAGKDGTFDVKLEEGVRSVTQSASPHSEYVKKERQGLSLVKDVDWDKKYQYPFSSTAVFITDPTTSLPNSPIKEFYWTFTDSTNIPTRGVSDTFIPVGMGSYKINFFAENTFGCIVKDSVRVGVYSTPVIAAIDDKLICKGEEIALHLLSR